MQKAKWTTRGALVLALAAAIFAAAHPAPALPSNEPTTGEKSAAATSGEPRYDEKGDLKRPAGYERWVFAGSNVGLEYSDAAAPKDVTQKERDAKTRTGNFHNVYINPEAYAHYVKTGTFPEKTVLVLDIFKAEERPPGKIISAGLSPGNAAGLAVAVKNSERRDGSKTDWAYYDFGLERQTAKAFPDKACYDCHLEHADDDNVWVQFYPTLRKHRDERAKR